MWCGRLWLVALVVSGWLLGCGGAQEKADAVGDIATDLADARGDLADRVTDLGPDRVAVDAVPDVDDAQSAQVFQKPGVIGVVHEEHIFFHRYDHRLDPVASCRFLTIFWAALARFSSSSRKRLIFRIASS